MKKLIAIVLYLYIGSIYADENNDLIDYLFLDVGSSSIVDTPIILGGLSIKQDSNWGRVTNLSYFTFNSATADAGATYDTEGWGLLTSYGLAHRTNKFFSPYLGAEIAFLNGEKKCTSGSFCHDSNASDILFGYFIGAAIPLTKKVATRVTYNSSISSTSVGFGWKF